jgi:uncharacterized repeat protein (TIGR03806 family)
MRVKITARSATTFAACVVAAALSAPACGSASDDDTRAATPSPNDPNGRGQAGEGPPARAEFGLDARPTNATCVAPARPPSSGKFKLEKMFGGVALDSATSLAQPPGDGTRWFVTQRAGTIVSFPAANPPAQPAIVANVAAVTGKPILTENEGGLLNLAFHPDFAKNGRLYISFTTTGSPFASEVGYLTSADRGQTFTAYTQVLRFDRPALFHCGSGLAFGPDGLLYLGFGDATKWPFAQMTDRFFGKVLRIDVDNVPAGGTYGIPNGNPFAAGGGAPEIFALGFRNPFRLSVDRGTGAVWVGDVGAESWEEVDLVKAGGNYGWGCREGAHDVPRDATSCPSGRDSIDPVVEHANVPPGRSVTGGIVYRGAAMPWLHGTYIYGDYRQLELRALSFDAATGAPSSEVINADGPNKTFVAFAEDDSGEIYTVTYYQSEIFKLVPSSPAAASTFPDRLSRTGCVDPADPKKYAPGLVSYGVNSELWSDGAAKERMLAVPDGKTIVVGPDGDFEFPVGTVLVKTFSLGDKRVETRLFVRHDDGEWAGYSYEWNEDQSDAVLLQSGKTRVYDGQTWAFPSRSDCMQCHTAGAGRALGPELGQLNGDHVYPSTNRVANQLKTLEHVGLFAAPLGQPIDRIVTYPKPHGDAPLETRARSYLHANCSHCHSPGGGAGRTTMDLRFATSLPDSKTCDAAPVLGDLGIGGAKLVAPGHPESSVISKRMHALDAKRMPPLASGRVDDNGVQLIDAWIRGVTCP